jgi:hypothetical protein
MIHIAVAAPMSMFLLQNDPPRNTFKASSPGTVLIESRSKSPA